MMITIVVLIFLFIKCNFSYEISELQVKVLKDATCEYEQELEARGYVPPLSSIIVPSNLDSHNQESCFMLPYIIFDPIGQLPSYRNGKSKLKCHLCLDEGLTMTSYLQRGPIEAWNNGRKKRNNPRMIYDIEGPLLLVSKVYKCTNGHDIPSSCCSDAIMDFYPGHMLFLLSHRSGITVRLLQEIDEMLDHGVAISTVEEIIRKRYVKHLNTMFMRYYVDTERSERQEEQSGDLNETNTKVKTEFTSPGSELIKSLYYAIF